MVWKRIKQKIAYKLILYILLFSSIITILITVLQIYVDYHNDIQEIHRNLNGIERSYINPISTALWIYNEDLIDKLLNGILNIRDIQYVEIVESDQVLYSCGTPSVDDIVSREFDLKYNYNNLERSIGKLVVSASDKDIYSRLKNKVFIILITQGAKTFMVSIFMFFLFQYLVTRHLTRISESLRNLKLSESYHPISLDRAKAQYHIDDELDNVVNAINHLLLNLHDSYRIINRELERRESAEKALQWSYDELEIRIENRTNELNQNRQWLDTILKSIGDAVIACDVNGIISFMNPIAEKLTGWPQDEALGVKLTDVFHIVDEKTGKPTENPVEKVIRDGIIVGLSNHTVLVRRDGARIPIDDSAAPIREDASTIKGVVLVFRDISDRRKTENERKRFEQRIRLSQKMEAIGTLAGGIAHNLNNILFPIIGYTEMALEDVQGHPKLEKYLEGILKAGMRAAEAVKQILTFSRMSEAGEKKPLQLQYIVKETLKLMKTSLPSSVEIYEDVDQNCGFVLADPHLIQELTMQLVANAFYAMRDTGGQLTIILSEISVDSEKELHRKAIPAGDYIEFVVKDTGDGIDPDIVEKIFEPYFTTKQPGEGDGMGLAVVHGIIEGHKGYITVNSQKGIGAEFRILFPKYPTNGQRDVPPPPVRPKGRERILLVDDEKDIASMMAQMLIRLGYHPEVFTNSTEALDHFKEHPSSFDIVITDLTMPHMTGDRLAKHIHEINPDIPIIVCSGFGEKIVNKESSPEISAYLPKPITFDIVAVTIQQTLQKAP